MASKYYDATNQIILLSCVTGDSV